MYFFNTSLYKMLGTEEAFKNKDPDVYPGLMSDEEL